MGLVIMAPYASGESGTLWTCPLKHDVGAMTFEARPKWLPKAVEPTAPATEGVSHFMPAARQRAAWRGQPGRRQRQAAP